MTKLAILPILTNQYNAFSQRILKTAEGNKYTYIYNTAGQLLEERNKNTGMIRDYIYADGQLIAAVENGITTYIVTDQTNTPQLVMDSSGKQIWNAKYDPFGKTTVISNYKLNLRADGQYQDDETGLYYNWYRYYNPDLGRYITSDPLGLQAGMNTYVYVNGDPINYTDPMGLETWQCTRQLYGYPTWTYKYRGMTDMYHQYSCTFNKNGEQCDGLNRGYTVPNNASITDRLFSTKKGIPSKDDLQPNDNTMFSCKKIKGDDNCYEECLQNEWKKPRPNYNTLGIGSGINCHTYDDNVNDMCRRKCGN